MGSRCQSTASTRALFGRRTILSAEPLWQTMSVLNDISKVTRTMPKSTTSPQFDSKLEPANDHASSLKRPGERSAFEELLRWLTRSLAILAVLSSVALLCVGATPMLSSLPAAIATQASRCLGVIEERPAVGPATPARGSFLSCIAGDTAPASARIVQTRDAGRGVSLVGNRPAHAGQQSRVRTGKSGDRALRDRSRRDHLERPGKESAAACRAVKG